MSAAIQVNGLALLHQSSPSPLLRVASCDAVSVIAKVLSWMWVAHARSAGVELMMVGSGQYPFDSLAETILITPVLRVTPVSGLAVRSVFTESVRSPSGERKQLQHSESS